MASPIILKPLALSATHAVPLVLCLAAPRVWDVQVREAGVGYEINGTTIPTEQLRARQAAPIQPLANQGTTDVREAFLRYANKQGLREEVRF